MSPKDIHYISGSGESQTWEVRVVGDEVYVSRTSNLSCEIYDEED